MSNALKQIFGKLGLHKDNGLHVKGEKLPEYSSRIKISLRSIEYDAIYNFDNKPLILFKEYEFTNEKKIKDFHNSIWNFGEVPILFIILPREIRIYNGFLFDGEKNSVLKTIGTEENLNRELDEFSFLNIISGNFWKENDKIFDRKKHVYNYLLENLKEARAILNKTGLPFNIIHNLIGRLIFSRYLIDRKVLDDEFFFGKYNCSFENLILDKEKLYNYFEYLKIKFNGDMFPLSEKEKNIVKNKHLTILNKLFNGDELSTGQTILFDIYDFSIIPIELISNIYETFLDKKDLNSNKSYFTPLFLVDYILDKTLDPLLEKKFKKIKILDPACGSGIFLVESLRRIIESQIALKGKSLSNNQLNRILKDRIFGIDKDEDAINISIFSIYLTLLDYQDSKSVEEFKFPELRNKNLFISDFFDLENDFNKNIKDIDLIVGNPPWGISNEGIHIKYCKENGIPISYKEIAQSFLVRVKDFANKDTQIALIVTSKILYNLRAKKFRNYFLTNFNVNSVLEFSPVRRKVFKNAIGPGSIIFYKFSQDQNTLDSLVEHTSLKPNIFFNMLRAIVIEKYDTKFISQNYFIENDWLWKVMLYGNVFDFHFIKRLKEFGTINELINSESLIHGVGIIKGGSDKKDASHLLGKFYLDTKKRMLQRYYINEDIPSVWTTKQVHRTRNPKLFNPPYVLIKTTLNNKFQTIAAFTEKEMVFGHSVAAIKGNQEDKKLLKDILGLLNSKLFTYFIFNTGSSTGVERGDVKEEEFLSFPAIISDEIGKNVSLLQDLHKIKAKSDDIKEIEDKMNGKIYELFDLNDVEKDLIDYTVNISVPLFNGWKEPLDPPSKSHLEAYAKIFVNHFGYKFGGPKDFFVVEIYSTNYFTAMNFKVTSKKPQNPIEFRKDKNIKKIINKFGILSIERVKNNLYINKEIKGFEKTSFYIIKPNEYKNWHKAVARLDLSEFINAIIENDIEKIREFDHVYS